MFSNVVIGFASESGNSERLARQLCTLPFFGCQPAAPVMLDDVDLDSLRSDDLLLIISSTFGDGEAPGNAEVFQQKLQDNTEVADFQYGVFALGDVAYPSFCQFGQWLDSTLQGKGAKRLINRVDADIDYPYFFSQWQACVERILFGEQAHGLDLHLKVTAYSESNPHRASLINSQRLDSGDTPVYHITLDISGSGMHYRAGDLLYLKAEDDRSLAQEIYAWFGVDCENSLLLGKELRALNKSVLRSIATAAGNSTLKERLKNKNKAALAEYLYGRDLLDVLRDCATADCISLERLAEGLSQRSPRAYSIASCGVEEGGSEDKLSLCVRDVSYELFDRNHHGAASHALCQAKAGAQFSVFARSNPDFHLDLQSGSPIIMIGAGTGIAPYLGFLSALETSAIERETVLIFGEKTQRDDFLYEDKLQHWLDTGTLNHLLTAFSRDQVHKHYVQHALLAAGEKISKLIDAGAHIYVCGSKQNLNTTIDNALLAILSEHGKLSADEAAAKLTQLSDEKRLHKDLY